MSRVRWIALAAALPAVAIPLSAPAERAEAARTSAVADEGARVLTETRVGERILDLEVSSPALGGKTGMVRLLLPRGYDTQPDRTWPVLYLLHGCCEDEDYKSWTAYTDVEEFTADKDALVVLPTDGPAGMYSAWWNWGRTPTPDWETFHVTEVRQILERGYRAGTRRAVAGLSIGGYGALAYAFRHQGMFGAAASYSGVPNTTLYGVPNFLQGLITSEGLSAMSLWGSEWLQRSIWMAHNPYDNVDKLRGVAMYVSSGNGRGGPLSPGGWDLIEPLAELSSKSFTDRLRSRGIPVTVNYYGDGTHTWPYWERELKASWPVLARGLGLPS
ncbi:alpha/beta hydrolase family protein [Actinokineospora soli]